MSARIMRRRCIATSRSRPAASTACRASRRCFCWPLINRQRKHGAMDLTITAWRYRPATASCQTSCPHPAWCSPPTAAPSMRMPATCTATCGVSTLPQGLCTGCSPRATGPAISSRLRTRRRWCSHLAAVTWSFSAPESLSSNPMLSRSHSQPSRCTRSTTGCSRYRLPSPPVRSWRHVPWPAAALTPSKVTRSTITPPTPSAGGTSIFPTPDTTASAWPAACSRWRAPSSSTPCCPGATAARRRPGANTSSMR